MAGGVILYLSWRFVAICFVTNNSAVALLSSRREAGKASCYKSATRGGGGLRVPPQQFDL